MAPSDGIRPLSTYGIRFQGRLEGGWSAWFDGLLDTREVCQGESQVTCLTVRVPDQAALRGILNRLWDLNLTLICVRVMETVPPKESEHGC